jgi:DNA-binding response OmpR family regulator
MKVLVFEENASLLNEVRKTLTNYKILCETAISISNAEAQIIDSEYDIIVMDVVISNKKHLGLVQLAQRISPETLIFLTTSSPSIGDKIIAFELGVDDYIVKPYDSIELALRLTAHYRRAAFKKTKRIEWSEINVLLDPKQVSINNRELSLTNKEYELLLLFISNQKTVLSKSFIAESLWGNYIDERDDFNFVYQHVKNLKKKIAEHSSKKYIKNVYGLGYKLVLN